MSELRSVIEVQIQFFGAVQGVGFRSSAKQLAEQFSLTGYAKNLPDGSVMTCVQGSQEAIKAWMERLHKRFSILKTQYVALTRMSSYQGFSIL